jgi:hypothetical protein
MACDVAIFGVAGVCAAGTIGAVCALPKVAPGTFTPCVGIAVAVGFGGGLGPDCDATNPVSGMDVPCGNGDVAFVGVRANWPSAVSKIVKLRWVAIVAVGARVVHRFA